MLVKLLFVLASVADVAVAWTLIWDGTGFSPSGYLGSTQNAQLLRQTGDTTTVTRLFAVAAGDAACAVALQELPYTGADNKYSLALDSSAYRVGDSYQICYDTAAGAAAIKDRDPFAVKSGLLTVEETTPWRAGRLLAGIRLTALLIGTGGIPFPKVKRCAGNCGAELQGVLQCADASDPDVGEGWVRISKNANTMTFTVRVPLSAALSGDEQYRVCWQLLAGSADTSTRVWHQAQDYLTVRSANPGSYTATTAAEASASSIRRRQAVAYTIAGDFSASSPTSVQMVNSANPYTATGAPIYISTEIVVPLAYDAASATVTLRVLDATATSVRLFAALFNGSTTVTVELPLKASLATLAVEATNPVQSFFPAVPRVGQLLTITFAGSGLSAGDEVWIQTSSGVCSGATSGNTLDSSFVAVSAVASTAPTSSSVSARFVNNAVNDARTAIVICYKLALGDVTKLTVSNVLKRSVPTSFALSVSPVVARYAVEVTFENRTSSSDVVLRLGSGDEVAFTTAASCDGSSSPNVEVATTAATAVSVVFNALGSYRVCYKLQGATWSSVLFAGSASPLVTVSQANPSSFEPSVADPLAAETFRLTFAGSGLSALDRYRVVGYTNPPDCGAAGAVQDMEGFVTSTRASSSSAIVWLPQGSYAVCYRLAGYSYAAIEQVGVGYELAVGPRPAALSALAPPGAREQQLFLVRVAGAEVGSGVGLFACSGGCKLAAPRCPLNETGTEGWEEFGTAYIAAEDAWLLAKELPAGAYVVCLNTSTFLATVTLAPAVPYTEPVVLGAPVARVREGMPFSLSFTNDSLLSPADRVVLYSDETCSCISYDNLCVPESDQAVSIDGGEYSVELSQLTVGTYKVCYVHDADDTDQTHVYVMTAGVSEELLAVAEAVPIGASFSTTTQRAMEKVDVDVAFVAGDEFSQEDELKVVDEASSCGGAAAASRFYGWETAGGPTATIMLLEVGTFYFCYKQRDESFFTRIPSPTTFDVLEAFPSGLALAPAAALNNSVGQSAELAFQCGHDSAACREDDRVLLVQVATDCDETAAAVDWVALPATTNALHWDAAGSFYAGRRVLIQGSGITEQALVAVSDLQLAGDFKACYYSTERNAVYFTVVSDAVVVHPRNPGTFTVSPETPTDGEIGVSFNIVGTDLSLQDQVVIAYTSVDCAGLGPSAGLILTEQSITDSGIEWNLANTVLHPSYAVSAWTDGASYKLCYKRANTRWSVVEGVFAVNAAAPSAVTAAPAEVQGPYVRVAAYALVRFSFSTDSNTGELAVDDTVMFVRLPADNPCLVTTPQVDSSLLRFDQPYIPGSCISRYCVVHPVTFWEIGDFVVCYRRVGRVFSQMGTLQVSAADPSSFYRANVPSAHVYSEGEAVQLTLESTAGAVDIAGDYAYLVQTGQTCILFPLPATDRPLYNLTVADATTVEGQAVSGTPAQYALPDATANYAPLSYDLCVANVSEKYIPGAVSVAPRAPTFYAADPVFVAGGGGVALTLSASIWAAGLPLTAADALQVVSGSACDQNVVASPDLTLAGEDMHAEWVAPAAAGTYSFCYKREGGSWSVVPREVRPYVRLSFEGAASGTVESAGLLDVSFAGAFTLASHQGIHSALLDYAEVSSSALTGEIALPPGAGVTVSMWLYLITPSLVSTDLFSISEGGKTLTLTSSSGALTVNGASVGDCPTLQWTFLQVKLDGSSVFVRVDSAPFAEYAGVGVEFPFVEKAAVAVARRGTVRVDEVSVFADSLTEDQLDALYFAGVSRRAAVGSGGVPGGPEFDSLRVEAEAEWSAAPGQRSFGPGVLTFSSPGARSPFTAGDAAALTELNACDDVALTNTQFLTPSANGETGVWSTAELPISGSYTVCLKPLFGNWTVVDPAFDIEPVSPSDAVLLATEFLSRQQVAITFVSLPSDPIDTSSDTAGLSTSTDCSARTVEFAADAVLRAPEVTAREEFYICYRRGTPAGNPVVGKWSLVRREPFVVLPANPTGFETAPPAPVRAATEGQTIAFSFAAAGDAAGLDDYTVLPTSETDDMLQDPCMALSNDTAGDSAVDSSLPPLECAPGSPSPCPYKVCYRRLAGEGAKVWASFGAFLFVQPLNPTGYTIVPAPSGIVRDGMVISVSLTRTSDLPGTAAVAPVATSCLDATVSGAANANQPVPAGTVSEGDYHVCYVEGGSYATAFDLAVGPPNPRAYANRPGFPEPGDPVFIDYTGDDLGAGTGKVVLDEGTADCSSAGETSSTGGATAAWAAGVLGRGLYLVCFQLEAGGPWALVPGGVLFVGKDPREWVVVSGVSVPYVTETLTIGFIGRGLTAGDRILILGDGEACTDAAVGKAELTFALVNDTFTTGSVCLTEQPNDYALCYLRQEGGGAVDATQVPPDFVVAQGPRTVGGSSRGQALWANEFVAVEFEPNQARGQVAVAGADLAVACENINPVDSSTAVVTEDTGSNTDTLLVSFPDGGAFNVYIANQALINASTLLPAVFDVLPVVLSFTPQTINRGASVVFEVTATNAAQDEISSGDFMLAFVDASKAVCDGSLACSPPDCLGVDADRFFSVDGPVVITVTPQSLTLCFRRAGGGWVPLPDPLVVLESPVEIASLCPPSGVVAWTQLLSVELDGVHVQANDVVAFSASPLCDTSLLTTTVLLDGTTFVADFPLPANTNGNQADGWHICYTYAGRLHNIHTATGLSSISIIDPITLIELDPPVRVGQDERILAFTPSALSAVRVWSLRTGADQCREACRNAAGRAPSDLAGVAVTGGQEVTLPLLDAAGSFVICVQRDGADHTTLSYAGTLEVAGPDPSGWTVAPATPYGGQLVTITFTVDDPSGASGSCLIDATEECHSAADRWLSLDGASNATVMQLQTKPGEASRAMKVCYRWGDARGWVEAPGAFSLGRSEPETVAASPDFPVEGLETSVSLGGSALTAGDELVVISTASASVSQVDAVTACLVGLAPSPACDSCSSIVTTGTSYTTDGLQLVEGFYIVCYRPFDDAGHTPIYAFESGVSSVFVLSVAAPRADSYTVTSQGDAEQRKFISLALTSSRPSDFTGDTSIVLVPVPAATAVPSDAVCSSAGLATGALLELTLPGSSSPVAASGYLSFPSGTPDVARVAVCLQNATDTTWVSVPPFLSSAADLLTILSPDPAAFNVFPPPGRTGVLNLALRLDVPRGSVTPGDSLVVTTESESCKGSPLAAVYDEVVTEATPLNGGQAVDIRPYLSDSSLLAALTEYYACYVNATENSLSEVPGSVTLLAAQPSSFQVEGGAPRVGQMVNVTFFDVDASENNMALFPTAGGVASDCSQADLNVTTEQKTTPAGSVGTRGQLGTWQEQTTYEVCYLTAFGAVSRVPQVSSPSVFTITVAGPNPETYESVPQAIYFGQSATLTFTGTSLSASDVVRFVKYPGDCRDGIPALTQQVDAVSAGTETTSLLDSKVLAEGTYTVCYRLDQETAFVMFPTKPTLVVNPPSPLGFASHPSIPRVGQQVTVNFSSVATASAADEVKLVAFGQPCTAAPSFGQFERQTGDVWLLKDGAVDYASSSAAYTATLCYKLGDPGAEFVPVGASDATSTFEVFEAHPDSYTSTPATPLFGESFELSFASSDPFVNDSTTPAAVKLVPVPENCGYTTSPLLEFVSGDPAEFTDLLLFGPIPELFPAGAAAAQFTVCYRIPSATFAALAAPLTFSQQPIQCAAVGNALSAAPATVVQLGQRLAIDLSLRPGLATANVAAIRFAPSHHLCGDDAAALGATVSGSGLSWTAFLHPSVPTDAPITMCWRDGDRSVWLPVCSSCTGLCRITVRAPPAYVPSPSPLFEGQDFALQLGAGTGASALDSLGFAPSQGGNTFVCGAPTLVKAVNASLAAFWRPRNAESLAPGAYKVCYTNASETGVGGAPVTVQLSAELVVHTFARCRSEPGNATGTALDAQSRRLTKVFFSLASVTPGVDLSPAALAWSTSPFCADFEGGVVDVAGGASFLGTTFTDAQLGSVFYACLKPAAGGWAAMCTVTVVGGGTAGAGGVCETAPGVLVSQDYGAVAVRGLGDGSAFVLKEALCEAFDAALHIVYPVSAAGGSEFSLTERVFAGSQAVCFLRESLAEYGMQYATRVCGFDVLDDSPSSAALVDEACGSDGTPVAARVQFADIPGSGAPAAGDRTLLVASSVAAAPADDPSATAADCDGLGVDAGQAVASINATEKAAVTAEARLAEGTWTVCYKKAGNTWWTSTGTVSIGSRNPASVSVEPAAARAGQQLTLHFTGGGFSLADSILISEDPACGQGGAYVAVANASASASAALLTPASAGTLHACYRVGECAPTVLPVAVTPFFPAACVLQTTPRPRFGESFTVNVVAGASAQTDKLTAGDEAKLVEAGTPCAGNTSGLPAVVRFLDPNARVTVDAGSVDPAGIENSTDYRVCYKLAGERWAQVGGTCAVTVYPRNPSRYETTPASVAARRAFSIGFHGDLLQAGDRFALVLNGSCAALAAADGRPVAVVNQLFSYSNTSAYDPGTYAVCYYSTAETPKWVELDPLSFAASNPSHYELVDNARFPFPLSGVVFTLVFHPSAGSALDASDVITFTAGDGEAHTFPAVEVLPSGAASFEALLLNKTYELTYTRLPGDAFAREVLDFRPVSVYQNPYAAHLEQASEDVATMIRYTVALLGEGLVPDVDDVGKLNDSAWDVRPSFSSNLDASDALVVLPRDTTFASPSAQCLAGDAQTVDRVQRVTVLYASAGGSSAFDVAFDASGSYVLCYRRRNTDRWEHVPFMWYTNACADVQCALQNQRTDVLFVGKAAWGEWSSAKGRRVEVMERLPVTLAYNATPAWTLWPAGDHVHVLRAEQLCGSVAAPVAVVSVVAMQDVTTASFALRINASGEFKFCYFAAGFGPGGVWMLLEPTFVVEESFPSSFQYSPATPRSGGWSVAIDLTSAVLTKRQGSLLASPHFADAAAVAKHGALQQQQQRGDLTSAVSTQRQGALLASQDASVPSPHFAGAAAVARRGALQQQQGDGVVVGVVAGSDAAGCVGAPALPGWATLVSATAGQRVFLFANKTGGAVSFCAAADPCPGATECSRYLGSVTLAPVGVAGLTYSEDTMRVVVHGAGLSLLDTLTLVPVGGECGVGGMQFAPESVSDQGANATFAVAGVDDTVKACYMLRDQDASSAAGYTASPLSLRNLLTGGVSVVVPSLPSTPLPPGQTVSPPSPSTPSPSVAAVVESDDDCSGNDLCPWHLVVLVTVVVFGCLIAAAAVFIILRQRKDEGKEFVQSSTMHHTYPPSIVPSQPAWVERVSTYPPSAIKTVSDRPENMDGELPRYEQDSTGRFIVYLPRIVPEPSPVKPWESPSKVSASRGHIVVPSETAAPIDNYIMRRPSYTGTGSRSHRTNTPRVNPLTESPGGMTPQLTNGGTPRTKHANGRTIVAKPLNLSGDSDTEASESQSQTDTTTATASKGKRGRGHSRQSDSSSKPREGSKRGRSGRKEKKERRDKKRGRSGDGKKRGGRRGRSPSASSAASSSGVGRTASSSAPSSRPLVPSSARTPTLEPVHRPHDDAYEAPHTSSSPIKSCLHGNNIETCDKCILHPRE
ncbi:hemagluttinin family protein [Diplonema papillatum]|nr:hemagluttinin family protein [Diplonema papillatum]